MDLLALRFNVESREISPFLRDIFGESGSDGRDGVVRRVCFCEENDITFLFINGEFEI